MKNRSKYSLRGLGLVLIIISILWLIIVSLASCDSKPKEESFYTFELTLVNSEKVYLTYRLEEGITDFYIEEHYGSYWLAYYGTNGYSQKLRSAVINFKLLNVESCQQKQQ